MILQVQNAITIFYLFSMTMVTWATTLLYSQWQWWHELQLYSILNDNGDMSYNFTLHTWNIMLVVKF